MILKLSIIKVSLAVIYNNALNMQLNGLINKRDFLLEIVDLKEKLKRVNLKYPFN